MSLIARELREVWDALRASNRDRDEALVEARIRKLRGIWDLRFPFEYPVTVLAGPNACGKSTVLFACACAYRVPGRGLRDLAPGRLFPDFSSRQPAVESDAPQATLCEDAVAEGVIRGVLDVLNVRMALRHEDVIIGRNTGRGEFPSHVRTLGRFGKLADFIVVLDGDSREMGNRLKAIAEEYGHALQPLFLPGEAPPEQWLWNTMRDQPDDYAIKFGLALEDLNQKMRQLEQVAGGAVQQRDAAGVALGNFATDIQRPVPDIARIIGQREAEKDAIPELLGDLEAQISRWRQL